jgi:hypothetical protein
MALFWPGPKILGLLVVAVVAGYAFAVTQRHRRASVFLLLSFLFEMGGLVVIYLVSPQSGAMFWRNSMLRVLVTPGALVWILGVLSAGFVIGDAGFDRGGKQTPTRVPTP